MAALGDEFLPPNEILGGYIFKCTRNTVRDCLERQIFGSPPLYRNSVEAITPGIVLFLYNSSTHRLHGVFEARDSGGYNIDPRFCPHWTIQGLSYRPAQVQVKWYRQYEPLSKEITSTVMENLRLPNNRFRVELNATEARDMIAVFSRNQVLR